MRMIFSSVYLELFELGTTNLVLGQHAAYRVHDQVGRMLDQKFFGGCFLQATHIARMTIVFLVVEFVAGKCYFFGVGNDYEITIINKGRKSGLVFSPQAIGNLGSQTTENFVLCVHNVPFLLDLVDWGKISFHYIPQMVDLLIKKGPNSVEPFIIYSGAGNEIRTRDFNLGKVALYH